MQLIKTTLERALQFTAKKNSNRHVLESVRVKASQVQATNGHYLYLENIIADCQDTSFDVVLEQESLKNALKVWPKKVKALDVDVEASKNGHVKFFDPAMPTINKVEGTYPQVEQVIPKDLPVYRTYLTPSLLETIGKVTAKLDNGPICLEFPENPNNAITITSGEVKIILMPATGHPEQPVGVLRDNLTTLGEGS